MSETPIHGVVVRDLASHSDARGGFAEIFRQSWFPEVRAMVQSNQSMSSAGVVRGMHYHRLQNDYWCFTEGVAFVGLFDLRDGSPTQGKSASLNFDTRDGLRGLFIPAGVAHGFCAVSAALLQYLVDEEFTGDDEHGFAWDDPGLEIAWPVDGPILSDRDRSNPPLADALVDPPRFAQR